MSTLARLYRITGNVQGVFFRASAKTRAEALGITGWARNLEDGSVEVHAEGSTDALTQFASWLHTGPPAARVDTVEEHDVQTENPAAFSILH
jgi:acylphosphatase